MTVRRGQPFNYDTELASEASGVDFTDPSMTQQQFKEETDINTIARRFGIDGLMPQVPVPPSFGDFCGIHDYQSALNEVLEAQRVFNGLPARIRERFANDPNRLILFLSDEGNRPEAIELGLLERSETPVATTPST